MVADLTMSDGGSRDRDVTLYKVNVDTSRSNFSTNMSPERSQERKANKVISFDKNCLSCKKDHNEHQ